MTRVGRAIQLPKLLLFALLTLHSPLFTPHFLAQADVPKTIHYQAKLTELDGTPLTGEHTITVRLYDALTGGAELWEERHTLNFLVEDEGLISIDLGSRTPFEGLVSFNDPVFLSVEIDTGGELAPRQALTSVGYALNADRLDGLDVEEVVLRASATPLLDDSVGAAALAATAIQPGDIDAGDLPPHASRHQPGGADELPTASAVGVAAANSAGASTSLARADHAHEGLHSLAVAGQPPLVGDAQLAAGANVTLSQSGQTITVEAAGAAATSITRATASASSAVTIGTAADTDLLSATITKAAAGSALLILATVQLNHASGPANKTVEVKLFRGATQLDASYTARIGTANQAVSNLPVSLHVLDTPAAGSHTITLRARSSGNGAQASVRRLTLLELP